MSAPRRGVDGWSALRMFPLGLAPLRLLCKVSGMLRPILNLNTVLLAILFSITCMNAQSAPNDPQTARVFRKTITVEQQLDYLLFLPKAYSPDRTEGWPMILFLHGAGERGADLDRVKTHGPPKRVEADSDFPFIVISPQCPDGRVWDNSELLGLMEEMLNTLNVDTNRVYLTGLSMGGYGTWSLGLEHPERFAAIAPICGGGAPISVKLADPQRKEAIKNLPVWAFHGAKDPVVPLEESQRMVDSIRSIGGDRVKLTVYPDAMHDSWTETYANPEFFDWLLQQTR